MGVLESIFRGFDGCNSLMWSPDNGLEKNKQGLTPNVLQFTPFFVGPSVHVDLQVQRRADFSELI